MGRSPIHPTSWKHNSEKVCLDGRGVYDFLCYCGEASCSSCSSCYSCSSSITSPKVSSISYEEEKVTIQPVGLGRTDRPRKRSRVQRARSRPACASSRCSLECGKTSPLLSSCGNIQRSSVEP